MDRPSTSQQSVEKIEMYEVREHVPYQAEITRAPAAYDEESGKSYNSSWDSAWKAICQLFNLIQHMQVAIVVFCLWHFALTSAPNGSISNLQLHIVFAGTGYQLFLVEAVLTLHRHNSWSSQLSKDGKRVVHGCFQLIGAVFVIAGTFLGLAEVNMVISTPHGICGVIALAFSLVSLITGILALFTSKVRLMIKNGPVKILHIAVGLFALSMGLITITLGFNMDYYSAPQGGLATALIVFVVMILGFHQSMTCLCGLFFYCMGMTLLKQKDKEIGMYFTLTLSTPTYVLIYLSLLANKSLFIRIFDRLLLVLL